MTKGYDGMSVSDKVFTCAQTENFSMMGGATSDYQQAPRSSRGKMTASVQITSPNQRKLQARSPMTTKKVW